LQSETQSSRRAAFSGGTNKNLLVQFKSYFMFCIYFNLLPVPTTINVLSLYAQFLSRSFKSITAVKNYVNGVRILHLRLDVGFPDLDYSFKLLIKGLKRSNPHEEVRALAITPDILLRIFWVLDLNDSLHRALWACFLLSFYMFARKSNMVPPSGAMFDAAKHLARGDVSRTTSGLVVIMKWSKTIQCGERHLLVPLLQVASSPLCPRRAYDFMIDRLPAAPGCPTFLYRDGRGEVVSLTHSVLVSSLRGLLERAGINSKGFSGHSFRRGGASFAFQAGVPGELIQLHGDWRSDAYLKYLSIPLQHRLQVTQRMRTLILSASEVRPAGQLSG